MDLEQKLNRLGKEVYERYPDINNGGCCVYAAMIVAELKKLNIPAKGIIASHSAAYSDGIDKVRPLIENNTIYEWRANGVCFSHVGVEFTLNGKKKHYDTAGVHKACSKLDGMPIYKGRMEYAELRALAAKKHGWNTCFNRKHIPAVRRLVKSFFEVDTPAGANK